MALKLRITREWLRRKLKEDERLGIEEPGVLAAGGLFPFPSGYKPEKLEPPVEGQSFPKPRRRST